MMKTMIRRLWVVLFTVIMVAGWFVNAVPAAAKQDDFAESGKSWEDETFYYINPIYDGIITKDMINQPERPDPDQEAQAGVDSQITKGAQYSSVKKAGEAVRKALVARQSSVTIDYLTSTDPYEAWNSILDEAVKHTGVGVEGDYLLYQIAFSGRMAYINGGYSLNYTMTYYVTDAQENETNSAVKSILSSLNLGNKSDYGKVKAIYEYMTSNITYDYEHLGDQSYLQQYTAYGAAVLNYCVCQGYAVLLYRLLLESGVDCRVITSEDHAWNLVKMGDLYYNADTTWDAGMSYYYFFLKTDGTVLSFDNSGSHDREYPYYTDSFYAEYPMSETDYNYTVPLITKISYANKQVNIAWNEAEGATSYKLMRRPANSDQWETVASLSQWKYADASLPMGEYVYKVRAIRSSGNTESPEVTITVNPFKDVSNKASYFNALAWAYNHGIVGGTSATTFSPNDNCTREQFAAMLWKLNGKPSAKGLSNPFKDVEEGNTFRNPIVWCYHAGIVAGTSSTTYSPKTNISRWQIMAMLWRMVGKPQSTLTKNPFTDVKTTDTYYKAALWAYEKKITSVKEFKPNDKCTRWQLVVFLYKLNSLYKYVS